MGVPQILNGAGSSLRRVVIIMFLAITVIALEALALLVLGPIPHMMAQMEPAIVPRLSTGRRLTSSQLSGLMAFPIAFVPVSWPRR